MDYLGTSGDDTIDGIALKLSPWTNIYGKAGNDRITLGDGIAIGGAGNDVITGTTAYSTAAYWDSTSGIVVNLATGTVQDGLGSTDTLINIHSVQGTGFNDTFTGSSGDDWFYGGGGNNKFTGGGGKDKVSYYFVKSTDATISYDGPTDTFTIKKNFSSADTGTDTLTGISTIEFSGAGSDNITLSKNNFVAVGGFLRSSTTSQISFPVGAYTSYYKSGDFNGDGHADYLVVTQIGLGTGAAPMVVGLGDGMGHFSDGTATVFSTPPMNVVGGGRTLVADFNKDGVSDILQLNFGIDAPPYPGGLNSLYLSSSSKKLLDVSSTLVQQAAQNHSLSMGDVNGDGFLDVLINTVADDGPGNELYLNDGTGHFVLRNDLLPHPRSGGTTLTNTSSGMADVNGDGFQDLILGRWDAAHSTPTSQVLLNDGTGNFTKLAPISLPASGVPFEAVMDAKSIDLNGDGLADLMLSITRGGGSATSHDDAYYKTAYIQLLMNKGNGQFVDETATRLPQNVQSTFAPGWFVGLTAVDFNRDGLPDILATGAGGGESVVVMNQGDGSFKPSWVSEVYGVTVTADVNEDGMPDLLTNVGTTNYVEINTLTNGHIYKASIDGNSIKASSGNDALTGSSANDTLCGLGGNDSLNGGTGTDTALYSGNRTSYTTTKTATGWTVSSAAEGLDTLTNIERLKFADSAVALDTNGVGGQAYRIYQAAFNRTPDAGGLGFWMSVMDGGAALNGVAQGFVDSAEFRAIYGTNPSNPDIITRFYDNVLHRPAEPGGYNFWLGVLNSGNGSVAQVLAAFSESAENQAGVIGVIGNGFAYTPFV